MTAKEYCEQQGFFVGNKIDFDVSVNGPYILAGFRSDGLAILEDVDGDLDVWDEDELANRDWRLVKVAPSPERLLMVWEECVRWFHEHDDSRLSDAIYGAMRSMED